MGEEKLKRLFTILLVALLPLVAQDSTRVKECRPRIVKKAQMKKWVVAGGIAFVSYYAGYVQGKHERKRRYGRRHIGDKDYPGK